MSEFTYTGPSSTLFLSKDKSQPLVTGQTYSDLDENHPQVKNLIAHKLLVKGKTRADAKPTAKPKPASEAENDATENSKQTNGAKGKQS